MVLFSSAIGASSLLYILNYKLYVFRTAETVNIHIKCNAYIITGIKLFCKLSHGKAGTVYDFVTR